MVHLKLHLHCLSIDVAKVTVPTIDSRVERFVWGSAWSQGRQLGRAKTCLYLMLLNNHSNLAGEARHQMTFLRRWLLM